MADQHLQIPALKFLVHSQHWFWKAIPDSFSALPATPHIRLSVQKENYVVSLVLFFQPHTLILGLLTLGQAAVLTPPLRPLFPALSSTDRSSIPRGKGQGARACLQGRKPPLDSLERREKCNPEISRKEKSKRFSPTTSSFNDLFTPHWQYVLITCFESGDTICGAPAMHQTSF